MIFWAIAPIVCFPRNFLESDFLIISDRSRIYLLQCKSKNIVSKCFISTRQMKKFLLILVLIVLGVVGYSSAQWGIECSADQLRNGQCKFNIYQTLGIRQNSNEDPTSVGLFLQDIVLSMTFFIGTLVTIVILYAGVMFIRSGIKGDDALQATAKKWIVWWLIGMLLVMWSYVIIRLVQYLVRWW